MFDQLVARQRWRNPVSTLTVLALPLLMPCPPTPSSRQNAPSIQTPLLDGPIPFDRRTGCREPTACDVVLFGYQNRRPGRWDCGQDTFCRWFPIAATRSSGTSPATCSTPNRSGPICCASPKSTLTLRRLERGLRTDILGIHFQGNGDRLHPRSMDVAEELLGWLQANPTSTSASSVTPMAQTGVGAAPSTARPASAAARSLIAWLVRHGIEDDRLEVGGEGTAALLYPDPLHAWQHEANRRVEIEVLSH